MGPFLTPLFYPMLNFRVVSRAGWTLAAGASWTTLGFSGSPSLAADAARRWLDGTLGRDDLKPAAESALQSWPVSPRVNRAGEGDEDATLLEPVPPERAAG